MTELNQEANQSEPKCCKGTKKDGTPCMSKVLTPEGFCFIHSPTMTGQRLEAWKKGGQNSAKAVRLRGLVPPRLVEVYDTLEQALKEVHEGKLSAGQAQAMASVSRAMVDVLTSGEVEERVRALEEKTFFGGKR